MTSIIMHLSEAELAVAYSALRARERRILDLAKELGDRGFKRAADRTYASYATTAVLTMRMRKHLDNMKGSCNEG